MQLEMEAELASAVALYEEQVQSVQQLLEQDPDNTEAREILEQLQEALALTRAAQVQDASARSDNQTAHAHETSAAVGVAADDVQQAQQSPQQSQGNNAPTLTDAQATHHPTFVSDTQPALHHHGPVHAQGPGRTNRAGVPLHPANLYYRQEPDFAELATTYPHLKEYMRPGQGGRMQFDYTSWQGTRDLTASLLQKDFGVTWELPEGQLVPPLTNRANYIHWIQDLLNLSCPPGPVRGLDIGCGANFIYCLLGAAIYGWHMVGADITDVAVQSSQKHIAANPHLAHLLEVRHTVDQMRERGQDHDSHEELEGGVLTAAVQGDEETFAFSMCNPPFFGSMKEANQNPNTACGGTPEEMVYPGGEYAFVRRMVADSLQLGSRVHWYTSMVGKKTTLKALRKDLHDLHVTALRTTEFAQGKTSRWAIAWSWAVDPNKSNQPLPRPAAAVQTPSDREPAGHAPVVARKQISFTIQAPDGRKLLDTLSRLLASNGLQATVDTARWTVNASMPSLTSSNFGTSQPDKKQRTESGAVSAGTGGVAIRISVFQQQKGKFEVMASVANSVRDADAMRFTQLMHRVQSDTRAMGAC